MPAHGGIYVLAGTNGAGKSSIGGALFERHGGASYDPDAVTRELLRANPGMDFDAANALAWQRGLAMLQAAIAGGWRYVFETTLGGRTITATLLEAAQRGVPVHMWYCGLASPELHIARVAARVRRGGHAIPEAKIRARYDASRRNLIELLPHLQTLRLHDNSAERPQAPQPRLLLDVRAERIAFTDVAGTPEWAQPIVAAAVALDPTFAPRPVTARS